MRNTHIITAYAVAVLLALPFPAMAQEADGQANVEATPAKAQEEPPRFDVLEFRVSGNSLLGVADMERTLYSHLGRGKVFADIEQARKALERRYRDEGYPAVMVDVPEQRVDGGVVWLKVTESRVADFRVTGSRYYSGRRLAEQVSALAPGNRLQFAAVQEQINAASLAFPGRAINPILRPGRTPGTVEAELKVQDTFPLFGSVEINDRYGENTSRWRMSGSVGYSNLWQRGHSLSLQYQTAPQETQEVQVWSGTYLFRVPSLNSLVALYAVNSESDVATLGDLRILGSANIYGARWILPWSDGDQINNTLTFGADYKDFLETADEPRPIEYSVFSLDFSTTRRDGSRSTTMNMGTAFGIRGLTNTTREFEDKRYLARPDFRIVRAGVEQDRMFVSRTTLHLKVYGQMANSPLISNEQYGVGGSDTVRGYREAQVMADDVMLARVEWHLRPFIQAAPHKSFHGLLFWDWAQLHLQEALPGQEAHTKLSSVGIGLRMADSPAWEAQMDLAQALDAAGEVDEGDMRWHVYFKYQF